MKPNDKPKLKPRGKAKRWTESQLDDFARADIGGADALARKLGNPTITAMWSAESGK